MPKEKTVTLHINTETGWRGGEQQVLYLATGLRDRGHRAIIAGAPSSALSERARDRGIEFVDLGGGDPLSLGPALRVGSFLKRQPVDLIHHHTGRACSLGVHLAWLAPRTPQVVTRRVDFVLRNPVSRRLKYGRHVRRVIAISDGVKDALIGSGIDAARIPVVHSGIDLQRWTGTWDPVSFRGQIGVPLDVPLVGAVGALVDHKDPLTLVRAFARVLKSLPSCHLVFVGEGELRSAIVALAAELGLADRVHLTGFINQVGDALAAIDVFALSSHLEGLCTSILDAMAMGVPVVATRTGGVPDAVIADRTGLLVTPRQPGELAEALVRMLSDRGLARTLAAAARTRVEREFSVDQMVEGTLRVYEDVLARG